MEVRLDQALRLGHEPTFGEIVVLAGQIDKAIRLHGDEADRDRIKHIVDKFRDVVEKVAEASKAHGFTITVGVPVGLSVSIEWQTDD